MGIKRWETLPILEQQLQQKLGDLIPWGGSATVMFTILLYSLISSYKAFSYIYWQGAALTATPQCNKLHLCLHVRCFKQLLMRGTLDLLFSLSFLIKILQLGETYLSVSTSAALMSDFLLHLIEPPSACWVLSSDVCHGNLLRVNSCFFFISFIIRLKFR